MMSFVRRLSLADLSYAATGYRKSHPNQIGCHLVVKGVGKIPEHKMKDAVKDVVRYCPILKARLRGFWIAKYWSDTGPLPAVRTIHRDWDGQCHKASDFIDTPLDLIEGPVAEIVQVIGRHTFLVFRVHHAATDGVGLVEFARAFFKVLKQETPEHFNSKLVMEKLPHGNLDAIPPTVTNAPFPYKLPAIDRNNLDRSRHWRRVTMPGSDKKILLKSILAISALARGDGAGSVRIHMPVNLRRHAPGERTMANMVGLLRMDIEPDDSERHLLKKIKKVMGEKQELPIAINSLTSKLTFVFPLMLLHCVEKWAMKKRFSNPRFRCSGTTSHMGNINLADFSAEYFQAQTAFGIPASPLGAPLVVLTMTNENCTEVVWSVNKTLISDEGMDDLVEQLSMRIESQGIKPGPSHGDLPAAMSA